MSPWELAVLEQHLGELFDALARPSDASPGGWTPAVDLADRDDCFVARIDLPGVDAADIEIVLHDRELRVAGSKRPGETGGEPRRCLRAERIFGTFALHIHLPAPVVAGRCRAALRSGVLEIALPRLAERGAPPQRIEISDEEP